MFLVGHVNRPAGRNRQESDALILMQPLRKMQAQFREKTCVQAVGAMATFH